MPRRPIRLLLCMATAVVTVAIVGVVGVSHAVAEEIESSIGIPQAGITVEEGTPVAGALAAPPSLSRPVAVVDGEPPPGSVQETGASPAQRMQFSTQAEKEEMEEYDPWEPYNEVVFSFNHKVFDRFLLKPLATVWDKVVPDWMQTSLANAFDNLGMPRRLVNNLLQAKFKRAGGELTRFFINSTFGIAGLFDIAKDSGLEKYDEDTGQTLGFYGVGPGPYVILPILPPLTVRDGVGYVADIALDPLNYFIPFAASVGRRGGEVVNDRSQNLDFFQSVEENTVDLYSAVRNAYLQRRQRAIEQ